MHNEYLTSLYLHNALASGSYRVGGRKGRVVSLGDLRRPMFVVGTTRDHVSPWRSVYKIHLQSPAEITFVLAHDAIQPEFAPHPVALQQSAQQHQRNAIHDEIQQAERKQRIGHEPPNLTTPELRTAQCQPAV